MLGIQTQVMDTRTSTSTAGHSMERVITICSMETVLLTTPLALLECSTCELFLVLPCAVQVPEGSLVMNA